MAWIAVDAGTSMIKSVAFSQDGIVLAVARERTEVLHPRPEFSEQSMPGVWRAAAETARQVAAGLREPVEGIAITAQGDGCWLVDRDAEPTGNAVLWNDGRAEPAVQRWRREGVIDRTYRRSGSVTYPGLANSILAWLREHDPERLRASRSVLSCNGWLFSRLTGKLAADLSDGSNPFSNVVEEAYDEELFREYGLTELRSTLPEIARGADLCAPLTAEAARQIGIPQGTPVVMAPYDIVTTAYGAGVTGAGQACVILGTTICPEVITADPRLGDAPAGTTIALGNSLFLRAMPTLAGCETLEWAAQMLQVEDLYALGEIAAKALPGANGLVFLPYVSQAGERSPFLEPGACGTFHGLKLTHTLSDLARAVYEGLSYVVRECLEAAATGIRELRVCGGGSQSAFWCQLIADVTGLPVLRAAESEIGTRGAFLFGLVITGKMPGLSEASQRLPTHFETFTPCGDADFYAARYARFLRTREAVRPLWQREEQQ